MAISNQTGIREYNGNLSQYTGMLGGLTADVHTLRSLNPETTNRVICVMYRGPYFLMHYFGNGTDAYTNRNFATYKKLIECYNTGIQVNAGDHSLATQPLQGGFASRSIAIPTVQNSNNNQQLIITVPELQGRPAADFHNMWIDGIADEVTGLTHYHGLVAGSVDPDTHTPQRIFTQPGGSGSTVALEPSPAWEVAEFLIIALDRSGARVEAAIMALGCIPAAKVGYDIFNSNASGTSNIQSLQLTYNCQFIESAYVNDLASRYVQQFAVFGNKMNLNPGAGDAFFDPANDTTYGDINSDMFNKGRRPDLDAVQSGVGNIPVFQANARRITRDALPQHPLTPEDHSRIYNNPQGGSTPIDDPYASEAAPQ